MRIEATKQRATATRVMRGKRFEHGRRRTSLTSVLLCLLTFAGVANAQQADSDRPIEPGGPSTGTPSIPGGGEQGWRGESIAPTADPSSICQMVESAAAAHGLPFEFFARVIWQESRFRSDAVGPVTRSGRQAQGIAQFMPMTAAERLLRNPFDPAQALTVPAEGPCGKVAVKPPPPTKDLPDKASSPWVVQLTGDRSEVKALAAYRMLQKKHEAILGNYEPVVIRTILKMGAAPIWTRVRIEANSRQAAEMLCSRLRAVGETCLVQRS